VGAVPFVFADVFEDVGVGPKVLGEFDGEGLGVHLGVVESHFDIQVSEVAAVGAFQDAQSLAMRMAA
jgi:hypothetical protein